MTGRHANVAARISPQTKRVIAFRKLLLAWSRREARSFQWPAPDASLYVRVISEILLQRTRAETVGSFFPRFIHRFPGWHQLACATDEELRSFLEPIGLWRRRASSNNRFPGTTRPGLVGSCRFIYAKTALFSNATCHQIYKRAKPGFDLSRRGCRIEPALF
jgi:hypothetical protein